MSVKKLIEVSLPLDEINKACIREKSIRHGHPSTLHLWWARRPLAAARAVIWASLVDDPSSHPEKFPTEEAQQKERERLHGILKRLIIWENSNNQAVLDEAREEIMKSSNGNPPPLLDPFAGGGAIPLEAMRLGLEAHAHDLNPVAVMINKAQLEIAPRFYGSQPVNPKHKASVTTNGYEGLAEDVSYYGKLLLEKTWEKVGDSYPDAKLPKEYGGGKTPVQAWIWARTVKCPNPVCGCEIPLVRSFNLSSKKGQETHIHIEKDGNNVVYKVTKGLSPFAKGTVERGNATCPFCGHTADATYVRGEGLKHRIGNKLMAVVAQGRKGKIYLSADSEQEQSALVTRPADYPDAPLPFNPRDFTTPNYGFDNFADLFTGRQMKTLVTLADSLGDVVQEAVRDTQARGYSAEGSKAYTEALRVFLTFVIDKVADYSSAFCSWHVGRELIRNTFGRQAITMVWDYAESNPFSKSAGSFENMTEWVAKALLNNPACNKPNFACLQDAQEEISTGNVLVSTDPPYYDNIGYGDLSDFFWRLSKFFGVFCWILPRKTRNRHALAEEIVYDLRC